MIAVERFQILISDQKIKIKKGPYNPEISSVHLTCDSPGRPRGFGQFVNRPGWKWVPLEAPGVWSLKMEVIREWWLRRDTCVILRPGIRRASGRQKMSDLLL